MYNDAPGPYFGTQYVVWGRETNATFRQRVLRVLDNNDKDKEFSKWIRVA